MLCQFCGKHEATNKFYVNFMGLDREVFLCDECLENFRQYAVIPQANQMVREQPSWPMSFSAPKERKLGADPFNVDAGREIKTKRKLNQLHRQLSNAIDSERYEDAAVLRDQINDIKKEVFINGK